MHFPSGTFVRINFPSKSVMVPLVVLRTATVAPINGSEVSASVTTPDIAPSVSLRNDLLFAKRFDDRLIEAKRNKKENID